MANLYTGGLSLLSSHVKAIADYFDTELSDIRDHEQINSSVTQDALVLISEAERISNAYS